MVEDKFILNCIIPTSEMYFSTYYDTTISILREVLQLNCYVHQFSTIYKEMFSHGTESSFSNCISSSDIFELLDEPKFWRSLRKLANGFETIVSIQLIKVCLYLNSCKHVSIDLLGVYFNAYVLLDTESMRNGVKQDPKQISRSLALSNRYLPEKFINIWLEHNRELLNDNRILSPDEYLFLASNSYSKGSLIKEKIPTMKMSIKKDLKTGTFLIENGLQTNPDFDMRLEKIMSSVPMNMIFFDYTYKSDNFIKEKYPPARKKALKMLETRSFKQFQSSLKDPELMHKLKQTLSDANLLLNKSKLNSENFSYSSYRNSEVFVTGMTNLITRLIQVEPATAMSKPDNLELTGKSIKKQSRPQTSRPALVRPLSSTSKIFNKQSRPQASHPVLVKPLTSTSTIFSKKLKRPLTGRPSNKAQHFMD
ncbi:hypothetical protein SteCoe_5126 [Stentor coeruleus]|uniref:Uncharacterized protein n=1 Tax=Stentor coeruleus TaxID=5963 RepID=A0A1R2CT34_9CILI|nr:hypothetical protein SteCoe_5126 [Stentor coeruleus]